MHVIEITSRYASFLLKDGSFIHCYLPRKPTREEGGGPIEWFSFTPTGECVVRECGPDPSQIKHQTAHSVVYGDTDSVFVSLDLTGEDFPLDSVTERLGSHNPTKGYKNALCYEAILLCEHMCVSVNRFFKAICGEGSTIDLSYEKLWLRLCLQDKKKYCGLRVDEVIDRKTGTLQYPYQKQMGLDTVRRSTAPFAKRILQQIIEHLTYDDATAAKQTLLDSIRHLKKREFDDYTDFLCTKKWSQSIKEYESNGTALPIHISLAKRLIEADASDRPTIGDRVPFFVVVGPDKKSTRGVSPRELVEGGFDLCLDHYLELLLNSCAKIFKFYFTKSMCEVEMRKTLQQWCNRIPFATTRRSTTLFGKKVQCPGCGMWVLSSDSSLCDACYRLPVESQVELVEVHRKKTEAHHEQIMKACGECMQVSHTSEEGRAIIETCYSVKCRLFYKRYHSKRMVQFAKDMKVTAPDIEDMFIDDGY